MIETDNSEQKKKAQAGYIKLLILLVVVISVLVFRANVIDRVIVDGDSMNGTLHDGDVLWAQKYNVNTNTLKRFDVVTVKTDYGLVIKRIIGMPNETIQIKDGYVYIDGMKLEGDFGEPIKDAGEVAEMLLLQEDEYFVMGDNRNDSMDSRVWGANNIEDIQGIVKIRIFPFQDIMVL